MRAPSEYYRELSYHHGNAFKAALLKVKRAKRHLLEAENTAVELPQRRGQNFVIGPKPDLGQVQLTYLPNPMPIEFAGVVGDAVHNIRSALDYLAVALTAPPIGAGRAKNAYFPTGKDAGSFEAEIRNKMKGAHPDGISLVRELEPYSGGKRHSLRALHDLDVLDKHKLLIPALAAMHVERLSYTFADQTGSLGGTDFQAVDGGVNFVANVSCPGIVSPGDFHLHDDLKATFSVVFGQGQPFEGEPIVPTLTQVADLVESVVKTCVGIFPNYIVTSY